MRKFRPVEKFKCGTCGKTVVENKGLITCCGITEDFKSVIQANKDFREEKMLRDILIRRSVIRKAFNDEVLNQ